MALRPETTRRFLHWMQALTLLALFALARPVVSSTQPQPAGTSWSVEEREFPALREEPQPSLSPGKSPEGNSDRNGGKKGSAGASSSAARGHGSGEGPEAVHETARGQLHGVVAQAHLRVNGTADACGARA